jgi:hypothetical protein
VGGGVYVIYTLTSKESGNETQSVIEDLSRIIVLPTDEEPTIATVTNLDTIQDQPFFRNAQIGDKVIIYSRSQKAILYRPSEKKLIEVAPFTSDPITGQAEQGNAENDALDEEQAE